MIVQAEFPPAVFGQVVSTIIAINQFTYSFGPAILGWLRDASGSYVAPLVACLALQLAAVVILLVGRPEPVATVEPGGSPIGGEATPGSGPVGRAGL